MVESYLPSQTGETLSDHAGASRPFSVLDPVNRHMPQRVRVLIDFIVERLATRTPRKQ